MIICFNDMILTLIFFDYYSHDDDSATSEYVHTLYQEIYGKRSFRSKASLIFVHTRYKT